MATAEKFEKSALVMGVLSTAEDRREYLVSLLEKNFGKIRDISPVMDFSFTDYYDREMGRRPVRYVVLFENLVDPSDLADIKVRTNELETLFSDANPVSGQGRHVNLDPGLLSLSNFILATCKNRSHRIALRNGIYAEVTLLYQNRDFQALPWTYADWASDELRAVLRSFRTQLRAMLRV